MNEDVRKQLVNNQKARIAAAREHFDWFFGLYMHDYAKAQTADFQKDFFKLAEDMSNPLTVIMAFRGSAKSSIFTTAYPLWAILGKQEMKFVLIASLTQKQARDHLKSIKDVLENNDLLKVDLGPFKEVTDEWGSYSLVIPKYNARIAAVSAETSVRGIRHLSHRPQLIICDDVEDVGSVKTSEGRKKTYEWFTKELLPTGDRSTRTFVVGNNLHEDSLLNRYIDKFENHVAKGVWRKIPLVDDDGVIAWPGMFPDQKAIDEEKQRIGDEQSWAREQLLKIIPDDDQVVHREWIQYYDKLPDEHAIKYHYNFTAVSVDPAISTKSSADYTAIVSGHIFMIEDRLQIFILPHPINIREQYPDLKRRLKDMTTSVALKGNARLIVEEVAYQAALPQDLRNDGFIVDSFHPHGADKRERLTIVSNQIKDGTIQFPKEGAENLIGQIVGFGKERHDDLSDALCALVFKVRDYINNEKSKGSVKLIHGANPIAQRKRARKSKQGGRNYWNRRLNDWDEATGGGWSGTTRLL